MTFRIIAERIVWNDNDDYETDIIHDRYVCEDFRDVVQLVEEHGFSGWSDSREQGWLIGYHAVNPFDGSELVTTVHPLNERSARK